MKTWGRGGLARTTWESLKGRKTGGSSGHTVGLGGRLRSSLFSLDPCPNHFHLEIT